MEQKKKKPDRNGCKAMKVHVIKKLLCKLKELWDCKSFVIAGHPLAFTFMHKSHKKHPKMTTLQHIVR